MEKIHPINAVRSRTWADSVPFEVALDEVDPGDEGVEDMGMGMEGVSGVETGVEAEKRLPWFVEWWVALTLPIALVFVVGVCHKKSVEDGGAPWGHIVRVRVRLFVLFKSVGGLCKYLAADVFPKTLIVVWESRCLSLFL